MPTNKKTMYIILILIIAVIIGFAVNYFMDNDKSSSPTTSEEANLYTCTMHPQIIQKGPGKCPICNMDLVPKKNDK
jgi:membrane fusion protein, copper/silver efflux system